MKKNGNLHAAKKAKNDEFYTRFEDVNAEVDNYREHFRGKKVYCNCDSAKSEFYRYFKIRFNFLGLSHLTATHYDADGEAYRLDFDGTTEVKTPLLGDGDFRSPESVENLKQSDVVVTNPPFSLFRDFIALLVLHNKKFLIIGSMNAITYKEIFPMIQGNSLWLGLNMVKKFTQPGGEEKSFGNICWFTNLSHFRRGEELLLYKDYSPENYPTYENYEGIEVGKVAEIPANYVDVMGVPITYLFKYNPDQFEILDINPHFFSITSQGLPKPKQLKLKDRKDPYARILIKKK